MYALYDNHCEDDDNNNNNNNDDDDKWKQLHQQEKSISLKGQLSWLN